MCAFERNCAARDKENKEITIVTTNFIFKFYFYFILKKGKHCRVVVNDCTADRERLAPAALDRTRRAAVAATTATAAMHSVAAPTRSPAARCTGLARRSAVASVQEPLKTKHETRKTNQPTQPTNARTNNSRHDQSLTKPGGR